MENGVALTQQYEMEQLEAEGKTVMLLATEQEMLGMVAVADTIKTTSVEAIQRLKKL
jgi:Cu+-exporting ATPase